MIVHPRFENPHIWMTYPLWHMKPIHVMKKWVGIDKLSYGASGMDGKRALQEIIDNLSNGYSTFITPDGPKGPLKVVKPGAMVMSLKSNTPIIPVSFHTSRDWRINSWDRKRYTPLFGTTKVVYGKPIYVNKDDFDDQIKLLATEMHDKDFQSSGDRVPPRV